MANVFVLKQGYSQRNRVSAMWRSGGAITVMKPTAAYEAAVDALLLDVALPHSLH
jgi:hypothetical protein